MKAIFITTKDIKRYSILSGTVDNDKFTQFVEIAQDIHIQTYLGTDLYEKIQELIINDTIGSVANANYKLLLDTYIKPMHVHWSAVEYMPYIAYTVANGGVYKHTSENSESVSIEEVNVLTERSRTTAQWYTDRMISYLCNNSIDFPEYTSNSSEDIYPTKKSHYTGWVM